jgi:hypothetical protein
MHHLNVENIGQKNVGFRQRISELPPRISAVPEPVDHGLGSHALHSHSLTPSQVLGGFGHSAPLSSAGLGGGKPAASKGLGSKALGSRALGTTGSKALGGNKPLGSKGLGSK